MCIELHGHLDNLFDFLSCKDLPKKGRKDEKYIFYISSFLGRHWFSPLLLKGRQFKHIEQMVSILFNSIFVHVEFE